MENQVLHIISHTHWDREWYYSLQRFRWRLVKLMDHLLSVLEANPEFKSFMMDGQFLAIKDYLEIRPEKEQQVRKFVREGRLYIGPWYTQPTESLSSGEALIRNLLFGIRESKNFGGVLKTCYLPDEFGHISQLPQICSGFGMKELAAWRGIPRDSRGTFKWIGSDGSEVLMFYINGGYGDSKALSTNMEDYIEYIDDTPFKRSGLKSQMDFSIQLRGARATTRHLMLLNGVDHSFAQENIPEVIGVINRNIPGVQAIHSTLDAYVEAVKLAHNESNLSFERYYGEMMDPSESPVLPDTHSMRADVKMWNSRIEGMFEKWMEPFAAFSWLFGEDYPQAQVRKAWEYLLDNQTHDSIDCSSVDAVYRHVLTRFEWAYELGDEITRDSMQFVCNRLAENFPDTGDERNMVVFNPLSFGRSGVVTCSIDIPEALGFCNIKIFEGNRELQLVVHDKSQETVLKYNPFTGHPTIINVNRFKISFEAEEIPANGYKVFKVAKAQKQTVFAGSLAKSHNVMENELIRLSFNSNGTFNLLDKKTAHQYNNLHFFEDSGEAGNGFEHEKPAIDKLVVSTGSSASISIIEDSPLKSTFMVEFTLQLPEKLDPGRNYRLEKTVLCDICSRITLKAGSPAVEVETSIVNRASDHRLRIVFPTGISTDSSYAEQPFDVVKRSISMPDLNLDWVERPRSIHPQQSFVDVSDGEKGLMIANQGLYEYEVMDNDDRSIALTLLRCTDKLHTSPHDLIRDEQLHQAQCMGEWVFKYSIIPHAGSWEKAYRHAYEFKFPMAAVMKRSLEEEVLPGFRGPGGMVEMPRAGSFIELEADNLVVSAVKKHEIQESLILRLFNIGENTAKGRVRIHPSINRFAKAYEVNLNEDRIRPMDMDDGDWVAVSVKGKGLLTIAFEN